jgi:hypothetical protein
VFVEFVCVARLGDHHYPLRELRPSRISSAKSYKLDCLPLYPKRIGINDPSGQQQRVKVIRLGSIKNDVDREVDYLAEVLVSEYSALFEIGSTLVHVQIGAADVGARDLHQPVGWSLDFGLVLP